MYHFFVPELMAATALVKTIVFDQFWIFFIFLFFVIFWGWVSQVFGLESMSESFAASDWDITSACPMRYARTMKSIKLMRSTKSTMSTKSMIHKTIAGPEHHGF